MISDIKKSIVRKVLMLFLLTNILLNAFACTEVNTKSSISTATDFIDWPKGYETGTFPVDGGKIYYHLYGKDKKGTPLIFLHGGPGGSTESYFKQVVLAEDRPVLFFNQLGSAGSDISDEYTTAEQVKKLFTIDHYVNEVEEVVNHFGFKNYFLLGHSWGSMLAIEYANAKKPKGLKGIVLSGPFLNTDRWIDDAERLIKTLPGGNGMWDNIKECEDTGVYNNKFYVMVDIYSENFYNRNEHSIDGEPSAPSVKIVAGVSPYEYMWGKSEFSCTGTLKGHDSTKYLKDIKVPILYICGDHDSGTPETALYYNSLTPNGEVCVLPDCSHYLFCERPKEYNAVVGEFLKRKDKE